MENAREWIAEFLSSASIDGERERNYFTQTLLSWKLGFTEEECEKITGRMYGITAFEARNVMAAAIEKRITDGSLSDGINKLFGKRFLYPGQAVTLEHFLTIAKAYLMLIKNDTEWEDPVVHILD